jgi:phytanoyl-CoA dioxygenase PhyH
MLNVDDIKRFAGIWGERHQTFTALRRIARTRLRRPRALPASLQRAWYVILQRRGIMVVPGFWSPAECASARAELERLERAYPESVHRRSDRRLFGVDRASPLLRRFAEHPELVALSRAFYATPRESCITLGAHLPFSAGNLGSGEGWHRDSLAPQFKAILYLTDVTSDTGPFELIPGSHRPLHMARDIVLAGLGARTRLSDAEVAEVERHYPEGIASVTGAQGTLVLVNSSAIHRGRPIAAGERVALTNYYYPSYPLPRRYEELFGPILPYA